jgi:hypothetical protein
VSTDRLYDLLPALYRLRDIDEGRPLQVLLRAVGEQAEILRQDVDRLWDDAFVETCRDWVVPYIGDLVANTPLHEVAGRARVDVARTIYYRRRKGTLPMLEELARDVTGWGAHAVEFFELLGWTQHLNHLRFQAGWPDVRDPDRMDRVDGPFDEVSHTVDVRAPVDGRHAITAIGFFLYRLRSYPLQGRVLTDGAGVEHAVRPQARPAGAPNRFHVSSLGAPTPLFNRWRREGDEAGVATEPFVPGPIRPVAFHRDLERLATDPAARLDYYGAASLGGAAADECEVPVTSTDAGGSLAVFADGAEVPAPRILCKDLSGWEAPPAGSDLVAVDVRLGRIAFAPDAAPSAVDVEYHYGFSGDIGGGPYDRRRPLPPRPEHRGLGPDTVADPAALLTPPLTVAVVGADHTTIGDALAEWASGVPPLPPVVIQVDDDRTYVEDLTIDVAGADHVVVQAANGRRPTLVGTITVTGDNQQARVVLDGLAVEGRLVLAGNLERVRVAHCTLVPGLALDEHGEPTAPGEPSIDAGPSNTALTLVLDSAVVGALRLPEEMVRLEARRTVIDGLGGVAVSGAGGAVGAAGPPTELWQVTVLGEVRVRALPMASEVIFAGRVGVLRTQDGCVRFSYVEPGSVTPRRYRCQPDLALSVAGLNAADRARTEAAMRPAFRSVRSHDPGYTQLTAACPAEIRTGAEDGSEMGVWSFLRNPQREANLRIRLEEYLPFGLEPVLVHVT